jgi:hypothetical protein
VCDTLISPTDAKSKEPAYKLQLQSLESRIKNIRTTPLTADSWGEAQESADVPIRLYQIAILIYMSRSSQDPAEPLANLDDMIDWAFARPVRATRCSHFFPLFILACEAQTDTQRLQALHLMERTEKGPQGRDMTGFRAKVQAVWAQRDLHANSGCLVDYSSLMSVVISSNDVLPSFV